MSELYTHKFVGRALDELCQSDDHIMPDPGNKRRNGHFMLGNEKHHCELVNNSSNIRDRSAARYADQEGDQDEIPPLSKRRNSILEKDSWARTPDCALTSTFNCDPDKKAFNIASDSTMLSAHGLKINNRNSNSGEFGGLDTILDDNDIKYFENAENKDSVDLLYCDWPEIENFEDIDSMFRNCESTFDLGVHREDNLGWLSSDLELSEVENISENHEFSNSYSMNDSSMMSAPIRYKDCSWTSGKSDSYRSFAIGPDIADCGDRFIPPEQVVGSEFNNNNQSTTSTNSHSRPGSASVTSEHKNQISPEMHSDVKSKEHYLGSYILPSEVGKLSSGLTTHQTLQPVHMQQHSAADSYGYSQNSMSNMHFDKSHLSDPSLVNPKLSLVKSETSDLTSISPTESSQNIQESSTMRPDLDDIREEAASFCQKLQLVLEKLDFKTKLCIRDSLYRLAQSAEHRHNLANLNAGCGEGDDVTNRCTSFMEMETDTNRIDRSVAHLLFHQSSNSSTELVQDAFPFKSSSVVTGPTTSPTILADKLVSEGNVSEVEKVTDEKILV